MIKNFLWQLTLLLLNSKINYRNYLSYFIVGSTIPWLYYGFYCQFYAKLTYIIAVSVCGISVMVLMLLDRFNQPEYRYESTKFMGAIFCILQKKMGVFETKKKRKSIYIPTNSKFQQKNEKISKKIPNFLKNKWIFLKKKFNQFQQNLRFFFEKQKKK